MEEKDGTDGSGTVPLDGPIGGGVGVSLGEELWQLCKSRTWTDLVLVTSGGDLVEAHKAVVAQRSRDWARVLRPQV